MRSGGSIEDLDHLQRRVDLIAAGVFAGPDWLLPVLAVVVDPRLSAGSRAIATTRHGTTLIRVSPRVAGEPAEYLRGTLAHEAGHLLLGRRGTRFGWAVAVALSLWAVAIGLCVVAVRQGRTEQTSLWFALAVVPALLALRVVVVPSRRCELAADRFASDLIGSDAVVRTLRHLHAHTPLVVRLAAAVGMDSHPSPRQRARRIVRQRLKARQ